MLQNDQRKTAKSANEPKDTQPIEQICLADLPTIQAVKPDAWAAMTTALADDLLDLLRAVTVAERSVASHSGGSPMTNSKHF